MRAEVGAAPDHDEGCRRHQCQLDEPVVRPCEHEGEGGADGESGDDVAGRKRANVSVHQTVRRAWAQDKTLDQLRGARGECQRSNQENRAELPPGHEPEKRGDDRDDHSAPGGPADQTEDLRRRREKRLTGVPHERQPATIISHGQWLGAGGDERGEASRQGEQRRPGDRESAAGADNPGRWPGLPQAARAV
ncbi:MAG TPA: hypothetical protein VIV12_28745 [Streptosporangiaceae bacterium]